MKKRSGRLLGTVLAATAAPTLAAADDPLPWMNIPTFRITNGPVGLGGGDCSPQDKATALPVALGLAASFDPTLANSFGDLIGNEARTLGLQELEGPGMDLARVGQGGRTFEYLGEDPYLAGTMAASEIKGIQSDGVTCVWAGQRS